ncbi:damage-inducible protein DinB [Oceanobacillus longus]|uniref:Damage-inducible protein DinB n=1 Tax=Oceanobacillus longus TaxID=930120 RepID=A0ABV8GUU4_9BACI
MNLSVFKDSKFTIGMIFSFVLTLIAVITAATIENKNWVIFIVLSYIILFFSIQRVDKLYREKGNES